MWSQCCAQSNLFYLYKTLTSSSGGKISLGKCVINVRSVGHSAINTLKLHWDPSDISIRLTDYFYECNLAHRKPVVTMVTQLLYWFTFTVAVETDCK